MSDPPGPPDRDSLASDGSGRRRSRRVLAVRFTSLASKPFRWQWTASSLSQLGFWLSTVALQWHVAVITDGDPFALGMIYFVMLLPVILLSPVAGWLLDSIDRVALLQWATGLLGIVALIGGIVLAAFPMLHLIGTLPIAFVLGCLIAFQNNAMQSLVPTWLARKDLSSGVAVTAMSNNLARMIGPALAAPLLVWGNAGMCLITYGVIAFLAWCRLLGLRSFRSLDIEGLSKKSPSFHGGLTHLRTRGPALRAILLVAAAAMLGSAYVSALPALAHGLFGLGAEGLSLLLTASGAGAFVGAVVGIRTAPRLRIYPSALMAVMLAIALVVVGVSQHFALTMIAAGVAAALNIIIMSTLNVIVQTLIDDDHRGRVMGLFVLAWGGGLPVGALLLGALGALIDVGVAIALTAAALALIASAFALTDRTPPTRGE